MARGSGTSACRSRHRTCSWQIWVASVEAPAAGADPAAAPEDRTPPSEHMTLADVPSSLTAVSLKDVSGDPTSITASQNSREVRVGMLVDGEALLRTRFDCAELAAETFRTTDRRVWRQHAHGVTSMLRWVAYVCRVRPDVHCVDIYFEKQAEQGSQESEVLSDFRKHCIAFLINSIEKLKKILS